MRTIVQDAACLSIMCTTLLQHDAASALMRSGRLSRGWHAPKCTSLYAACCRGCTALQSSPTACMHPNPTEMLQALAGRRAHGLAGPRHGRCHQSSHVGRLCRCKVAYILSNLVMSAVEITCQCYVQSEQYVGTFKFDSRPRPRDGKRGSLHRCRKA